jgi:hypothetical protein
MFHTVSERFTRHKISRDKCALNIASLSIDIFGGHECGTVIITFPFIDVTWHQASKHMNKSVIGATVNMYRSEDLVVSSE